MKSRFFRSYSFELKLASAIKRGLFYDLILGIEGPVDSESGMILNLVHVDALAKQLLQHLAGETWGSPEEALRSLIPVVGEGLKPYPGVNWHTLALRRPERKIEINEAAPHLLREEIHSVIEAQKGDLLREKWVCESKLDGKLESRAESRPGEGAPVFIRSF